MSALNVSHAFAARLRRVFAGGCAALVLALTVFAASPAAHDWLHDADHGHTHDHSGEDTCAIVLFAGGVSLPVEPLALTPPTALAADTSSATPEEELLVTPRYLRQPERGPPVNLVS